MPTVKRIRTGTALQRVTTAATFNHVISSAAMNDIHPCHHRSIRPGVQIR